MTPRDENQHDSVRALQDLISAFSGPHWVHPAYVEHVLAHAADLLDTALITAGPERRRMPTLMWPRSAVFEIPNPPPVPSAAL